MLCAAVACAGPSAGDGAGVDAGGGTASASFGEPSSEATDGGTSANGSDGSGVTGEATTTAGGDSTAAEDASSGGPSGSVDGIWISTEELLALPIEGPAWDAVLAAAQADAGTPDLSDQDQANNVRVLAKAYVCVRLDDAAMCDAVRTAVMAAIGTEDGGRTLALGRELAAYVIAADLVPLSETDDATFRAWLVDVLDEELDGQTLVSTHETRPNNWGTHAGASRLAAAIYLGDDAQIERCATVFRGWLGDRESYAGFEYGELDWQADADAPVGINPVAASIEGHDVDGVLPDDQRRAGAFAWPPPKENYVWEALQGAVAQAAMLERRGYDAFAWQDAALTRALVWLHDQAEYPAAADDTWVPHVVNAYAATSFPAELPSSPGKNVGFTDWTLAPD